MSAGRPPTWTDEQKAQLRRLWPDQSSRQIGVLMGVSAASVRSMADRLDLPEKKFDVFCQKIMNTVVCFKLPLRPGTEKLLRRWETLRDWVAEGRDNYELARSFHVPIRDVEAVVEKLGLARPAEQIVPDDALRVSRRCLNCNEPFIATRYRFRCDQCVAQASRLDDAEYEVAA